jgi:hypothetical protein
VFGERVTVRSGSEGNFERQLHSAVQELPQHEAGSGAGSDQSVCLGELARSYAARSRGMGTVLL